MHNLLKSYYSSSLFLKDSYVFQSVLRLRYIFESFFMFVIL